MEIGCLGNTVGSASKCKLSGDTEVKKDFLSLLMSNLQQGSEAKPLAQIEGVSINCNTDGKLVEADLFHELMIGDSLNYIRDLANKSSEKSKLNGNQLLGYILAGKINNQNSDDPLNAKTLEEILGSLGFQNPGSKTTTDTCLVAPEVVEGFSNDREKDESLALSEALVIGDTSTAITTRFIENQISETNTNFNSEADSIKIQNISGNNQTEMTEPVYENIENAEEYSSIYKNLQNRLEMSLERSNIDLNAFNSKNIHNSSNDVNDLVILAGATKLVTPDSGNMNEVLQDNVVGQLSKLDQDQGTAYYSTTDIADSDNHESFKDNELIKVNNLSPNTVGNMSVQNSFDSFTLDKLSSNKGAISINHEEFIELTVSKFKNIRLPDITELRVKLNPEELGELSVKVVLEKGQISGTITAANKEIFNILQSNVDILKQELKNNNLNLTSLSVNINNSGDFEGRSFSQGHGSGSRQFNRNSQSYKEGMDSHTNFDEEGINIIA